MNRHTIIATVSIAFLASASSMAQAEGRFYAELGANVNGGITLRETGNTHKSKSGLMPEATLGYDFDNGFAVEVSYQKSGGKYDSFTSSATGTIAADGGYFYFDSTIIKGIYYLPVQKTTLYRPYVGIGLGTTSIKLDNISLVGSSVSWNIDGTATSSQFTLGNRFELDQGWFGDLALNYTNVQSTTVTNRANNADVLVSGINFTTVSFAVGKSF